MLYGNPGQDRWGVEHTPIVSIYERLTVLIATADRKCNFLSSCYIDKTRKDPEHWWQALALWVDLMVVPHKLLLRLNGRHPSS